MTDDTDQTHKDRWWNRVYEQIRANEAQATPASGLVVSNHLLEPTDMQAEGIRTGYGG